MFDKMRQVSQAAIVHNKHLDAALPIAKVIQEQLSISKRNNNERSHGSQPSYISPVPVAKIALPKRKGGYLPKLIAALLESA